MSKAILNTNSILICSILISVYVMIILYNLYTNMITDNLHVLWANITDNFAHPPCYAQVFTGVSSPASRSARGRPWRAGVRQVLRDHFGPWNIRVLEHFKWWFGAGFHLRWWFWMFQEVAEVASCSWGLPKPWQKPVSFPEADGDTPILLELYQSKILYCRWYHKIPKRWTHRLVVFVDPLSHHFLIITNMQ